MFLVHLYEATVLKTSGQSSTSQFPSSFVRKFVLLVCARNMSAAKFVDRGARSGGKLTGKITATLLSFESRKSEANPSRC